MKRLLEIIILFLILINPLKADDIQSFEIDGMSIGDSLLKYFNEKEINNSIKTEYASKKFYSVHFSSNLNNYDQYSFSIKTGDKKYMIYDLSGDIYFVDDLSGCLKKKKEIVKEISSMYSSIKKENYSHKYKTIADGKSISEVTDLEFKNGFIRIYCNSYSKETEKLGFKDSLVVSISNNEFMDWLNNEAYK